MDSNGILSLLGLALRGNNLAVGEEPVEAVARARDARLLLLASDAAANTRRRSAARAVGARSLCPRRPVGRPRPMANSAKACIFSPRGFSWTR